MNADMLVPQKFHCPSACVEWPQELWGFKLGAYVSMIRGNKRLQTKRQVYSNNLTILTLIIRNPHNPNLLGNFKLSLLTRLDSLSAGID